MRKKYLILFCFFSIIAIKINAQYTNIPDANFEAALDALGYDDISGDGQVPTSTIEVITTLDLNNQNISDLTGINDFIALQSLKLQYNNLTSLDVSSLVNLRVLWAANGNIFSSIDVSNNTALEDFRIRQYTGTTIDLSALTALRRFSCTSCDLATVDLSNNANLTYLDLWNSDITSLDVSANVNLATLDVYSTKLTSLDLSSNTSLTNLIANDIATLTSLNVQNGNNTNVTNFKIDDNTSLACVKVDNAGYSETNWTDIDTGLIFSSTDYCEFTTITDSNFEARLNALGYDDVANDGRVPTQLIEVVTSLDVSNQSIADLTGIQDFAALTDLNCENNSLIYLDVSLNTNLQSLIFNENNIATINLGSNSNLTSVEGKYNQLGGIDITQNTGLTFLNIRNNSFSSIDVSNNTLLETINIRECANVTVLDVSNNTNLKFLYLQDVSLTSLDISQNTLLEVIALERNNLSTIDVSNNTLLRQLRVSDNNLTRLDASNNPALTRLSCDNNNLTFLNAKNGNNTAISNGDFTATGNTSLSCIKVDDASWSNTNWTNIDSGVTFYNTGVCRYTAIPDANFEASLENLGYDDISGDGKVPTENIETITELDIKNDGISNLTGIEDFISLIKLDCKSNSISSIDLTNNTNLEILFINENNLTSIDLSKNVKLTSLDIGANSLTSIDVSNNTALTKLECPVNDITSIDISNLTQLTFLELFQTDITTLNLSNNLALENLILYKTKLTSLDVSLNTELKQFRIDNTDITSIDLTTNTKLTEVRVNGSDITSIDLTNQIALTDFYGQTGVLEYINIKNGNNTNINNFDVRNNDDLTCVTVDNATYSGTNWTDIGTSTNFTESLYCDYTDIPDANFEARLEAFGYDDISGDGKVPTKLIEVVTSLTINNQSVTDFTGIENFVALTYLDVGNNSITSLDILNLTSLEFLRVDGNSLTSLDITKNTALIDLRCSYNSGITSIDLSKNTLLETAHLGNNSIASLDVSNNTLLYDLRLTGNNLTALSLTNNTALETLIVSNNTITTLDLTTNTALTSLYGANCGLTSVTNINSTALQYLYLQNNNLTSVNYSNSAASILNMYLYGNEISELDFTGAINLKKLSIYDNNLISLDVTEAVNLEEIYVTDNDLTYFNLKNGNNTAIHEFHADNNPSLTCILVDNASTSTTRWSSDIDNTASFSDTYCRYTAIPDTTFETKLEGLGYDDISGDGQVPTVLIEVVTSLNVNDLGINELTGIEDFTALVTLNARGNNFNTLDVSKNLLLQDLYINSNKLSSIDVSSNVLLRNLNIGSNTITSLDVSNNPDLRDLWVQGNGSLTTLNLSNNLDLRELYTYSSGISTLDLSIHTELRILSIYKTSISSIDLSNNTKVNALRVDETNITELNLTNNPDIETLRVNDTGITTLDLSSLTKLEKLWAHDTSLSNLNVKNGNNTNVTTFEIENNPSLTCILVDDASYSSTNWTDIDDQMSFNNVSCEQVQLAIKVYLQGAFLNPKTGEESLMRDDLRTSGGLYGSTSLYSDGATISDAIKTDDAGSNSMVDWVSVELRDSNDTSIVIAQKSGVLQRDGDIVDVTDSRNSPLSFSVASNNYYIVIKHRNHLSIMTSSSVNLSSTLTSLDLTTNTNLVSGGVNALIDMGNGIFTMISGDFDENGQIQNIDTNSVIQSLGISGYNKADLDMNGQVQNADINNLLNPNIGKGEQF